MAYRWYDLGNGRQVYRRVRDESPVARSDLPTPMLIRDFDEPVRSCADGKWYTSKRDLAASHRASGNPHGVDFIEIGNEKQEFREFVPDEEKLRLLPGFLAIAIVTAGALPAFGPARPVGAPCQT